MSTAKKDILLFTVCLTVIILMSYSSNIERTFFTEKNERISCSFLLDKYQLSFDAMVIDLPLLKQIQKDECYHPEHPIRVAVLAHHCDEIVKNRYSLVYDIIYYKDDFEKGYLKLYDNVTRIIPRLSLSRRGHFLLPQNVTRFVEYFRRSQYISCLNLNMNRGYSNQTYLPIKLTIETMVQLRTTMVDFDMYPYLNGGTLLGWYRECGIIPHTQDVDLAVSFDQHNPQFLEYLQGNDTKFRLRRKFGRPADTYEFTLLPLRSRRPAVDVFFMYRDGNTSWVGGTAGDGTKYRYEYPSYDPWCAADLYGQLFWVTCRPEMMIESDYGKNWFEDVKTNKFVWNKSGKNVKKIGKWTRNEMRETYKVYFS